jgi:predicted aldo/keto reductase-like oxidoreductase
MKDASSRRQFLAAGLALPAVGMASVTQRAPAPAQAPSAQAAKFTYGVLGKTGLKVTRVGFGCMVTSDQSVIERGADLGITYFDSARGYSGGNNERMVGAALKSKRKSLVLSTKTQAGNKQEALGHLDISLRELGTDYIDIWYLHGKGSPSEVTADLIDAQQTAKKSGKVRFTGVSMHSGQAQLIPALVKGGMIDVILTAYNFTMDPNITEAVNAARKAGVGIVAMKVMAGGPRRVPAGSQAAKTLGQPGAMLSALKWVLNNPNVDTTIPSITDNDQLEENLKAMTQPFSEPDKKLLAAHLEQIRPLYCRMCGGCDGVCTKGLPVADMLRYLTYADGYGQFALGREHFQLLSEELKEVRCSDCEKCSVQCPNGVQVTGRLRRAQELFA